MCVEQDFNVEETTLQEKTSFDNEIRSESEAVESVSHGALVDPSTEGFATNLARIEVQGTLQDKTETVDHFLEISVDE